jgi:hypothetical protein
LPAELSKNVCEVIGASFLCWGAAKYTIATSGYANIKTFSKLNVVPVGLLAAASYKGKGHPALLATQAAIILAYGYIGFVE